MTIKEISEKTTPILKEAGASRSAVFGSAARGEITENSDIDILVEFREPIGLFGLAGLQRKLEEILGRKVDLLTYRALSPLLKDIILKEAVSLYE